MEVLIAMSSFKITNAADGLIRREEFGGLNLNKGDLLS